MFSLFKGRTPAIRSHTQRSIATLEQVRLGGVDQWITIRSHDTQNPILLYVHGGPGFADMGALRHFHPALEEHFAVVQWSQRGAGKSYSPAIPAESMTVDQFVDDLEELARYLLKRFGQRKLFLVGHSWGSLLSMRALQRSPELFHAYVGVNQMVNRPREQLISYRHTLELYRQRGNRKVVAQLEAMGEPTQGAFRTLEDTALCQRLAGMTHDPKRFMACVKVVALSSELTLKELPGFLKAMKWNMERLTHQFCQVNLCEEIPEVKAPVYFVAGRHDHHMNPELEAEYLEMLRAPHKEFILFENSGHMAWFEEAELFNALLLKVLRDSLPVPVSLPRA
jgi:proline iminopeptidase